MASKTLIFFDLETTGLQTDVCNIIQVSAICEGRAFNGYAVPELPLSEHVRNLTGFTVDGPYLYRHGVVMQTLLVKDLLRRFIDYLSQFYCPLLVAHNAEMFDAPVIMRVMAENGLLQRFRQVVSGFVDTYQLIKRLSPCLPGYSLTALARQFLGQRFDAHNALEDAKILEKLFITWRPSKHHVDMCTSSI
ncbi:uncharacterized protein [Takifugu rubripes]|uniref:uncharacterized protein n=1 Tax=Takifugu rubripes TaxID=31033 RepID=UPI0011456911|nr:uncharacterized protein LOC115250942 [Takifugu rubripes]